MELKRTAIIMMALIGVLLTILGLQGVVAGEWTTTAQLVAPIIGVIAILILVIALMLGR